jgi:DNA-binding CsgD family transcriptional regulator
MTVFQFAIQNNEIVIGDATLGFSVPLFYVWIAIGVIALIGFGFLALWLIRRKIHVNDAVFEQDTLLVMVPKYRQDDDGAGGEPSKDRVVEQIAAAESFFSAIGGLKAQRGFKAWLHRREDEISFEIVVEDALIKFYVTVPKGMRSFIEQQLSAAYPDVEIEDVGDYNIFQPKGVVLGSYLTFKREDAFPIKTYKELEKDPLNALTNAVSKIPEDQGVAYQFIVRSAPGKWRDRGVQVAQRMQQGMKLEEAMTGKKEGEGWLSLVGGGSKEDDQLKQQETHRLSPQEEEIVKRLEEKASKAGMEVCMRLMVTGKTASTAKSTLNNMLNAFSQYNIYQYGNSFQKVVPRSKKRLAEQFIFRDFDDRHTVVLNAEEMASLWHLPLPTTETPNIKWLGARKAPVPSEVPKQADDGLELGYNVYRGVKTPVAMKKADRRRHMYLIGKSGSGKSNTIANYAIQDIKAGRGIAVVEPHGDLTEQIIGNIPEDRVEDVVYFNPSDLERPMGLNMLEAGSEAMKDLAVQDMISIFYKLFPPEMIGPMFEHNMRNVMLTLMADDENPGTIAEIPRMFSDEDFQKKWVDKVTDPVVRSFWEDEMENTSDYHKSEMLGYLISKVGRFVENEMMRNIIGQSHSAFDFREIMDDKKILLVNLAKGKTGDVNAELLGMIIVSKLQMAAMQRADMPEEERNDFYLYIDEFQNFITDSIATILAEARKYRLDLIIAHQYIGQLVEDGDTTIKDAVFGNVGTTFVSRIGPEDVDTLEKIYKPQFGGFDLINSPKYTWYLKMIVDNSSTKPFTLNLDLAPKGDPELADAVRELSRLKYGRDRSIVNSEIMERAQLGTD